MTQAKMPAYIRADVLLVLVHAAKRGQTVQYLSIMRACGIPRGQPPKSAEKAIGYIVGAISEWTSSKWSVFLSSIVVEKSTGYPGGGFFGSSHLPKDLRRPSSRWMDNTLSEKEKTHVHKCQADVFEWARTCKLSVAIAARGKKMRGPIA